MDIWETRAVDVKQEIFVLIEHFRGQVTDISYTMLAAAHHIAEGLNSSVVAVLLSHNEQELANNLLANRVLYFDHPALADFSPSAYQRVLGELIYEHKPRLVLCGDTTMGVEVAAPLSIRLNIPLVSYCRSIYPHDGKLIFTSQICGGKIMAEGDLPGPTAIVTMIPGAFKAELGHSAQPPVVVWATPTSSLDDLPVRFKKYIEPNTNDVDITKEPILISVGRGIQNQDNIPIAQELADALGGVVCASRPVVDQGWLPTTRLVGKSGKRVKPKIYLALGISGATEHVEAIADSEMIIAINTDPGAPIFDLAQFGATVDLFDLLPALTENVRLVKQAVKV
jgi:electron transfer flavoprotein alpha subunit